MKSDDLIENTLLSVFGFSLMYFGLTNYFGNVPFSLMLSALGVILNIPEFMMIFQALERRVLSR
jgi:hypothetical protein